MAAKGLIFDLDGTLIDSTPYHARAFMNLLKDEGIRISASEIRKLIGMSTLGILQRIGRVKKSGLNIEELREERHYHYFKLIGQRNLEFRGVIGTLRQLRKRGFKTAIATGSSSIICRHSTSKKFRELFDVAITIDDVARGKPAPDCLLLAAAEMRLSPSDCVVVGDSKYDRIAAQKAGMGLIGVLTGIGNRKELGRHCLRSVNELSGPGIQEAWNNRV